MRIRLAILYPPGMIRVPPLHDLPNEVTVEAENEEGVTDEMVMEAVRLRVAYRNLRLRESIQFGYMPLST